MLWPETKEDPRLMELAAVIPSELQIEVWFEDCAGVFEGQTHSRVA